MTKRGTTYRIIRCSADYGLVIAVTPGDAKPDSPNVKYFRCADWQFGDETPDQFHEISYGSAMGYFSGHADGLGFGMKPHDVFASLDDALAYRKAQRCPTPSALKETPTSRFFLLLTQASCAAQAVDDFNKPDFTNPESVTTLHELEAEQRRTAAALIRHCQAYGDAVIKDFGFSIGRPL